MKPTNNFLIQIIVWRFQTIPLTEEITNLLQTNNAAFYFTDRDIYCIVNSLNKQKVKPLLLHQGVYGANVQLGLFQVDIASMFRVILTYLSMPEVSENEIMCQRVLVIGKKSHNYTQHQKNPQ